MLFCNHTQCLMYKKLYLYICGQLSVFPNTFVMICPVNLKIGMLYHMNNIFRNTVFWMTVAVRLKLLISYRYLGFKDP